MLESIHQKIDEFCISNYIFKYLTMDKNKTKTFTHIPLTYYCVYVYYFEKISFPIQKWYMKNVTVLNVTYIHTH